jgi:hypothetical protein
MKVPSAMPRLRPLDVARARRCVKEPASWTTCYRAGRSAMPPHNDSYAARIGRNKPWL